MPRTKRFAHIILERFGGWFTDLLLTQSQEDAAAAIKYKFVSKDKVLAIGNGVDINKFNPSFYTDSVSTRASLGIPADAFVIGMIGRFVREKGYLEFLTAAQQLAGVNVNVYFLLVGQRLPSDHDDSIESALYEAQRVISTRMLLTGFRSDTPALLSAMDVFCLPSHREGMPRTIIEAMMMAKPVVATDIRGSREQVLHNETGYLVPTKNVSALAEHLQKLITNPKTGVHFGELGRERALQLYDEQVVIRKQINVIKNLTQQYAVSNAK
jgi:glycosyltransferase involved in cell wall biosynthesis